MQIDPQITTRPTAAAPDRIARMREAAEALEASFLSEMLKSAGLDRTSDTFGGGIGEEQFASLMREQQARQMVAAGGIGLAEKLFQSLMRGQDAQE